MKTKFVFWYWKEHYVGEQSLVLNSELIDFLKNENIPLFVYQQLLNRDKQLLELCKSVSDTKIVYFAPEECRLFVSNLLDTIKPILKSNNNKLEIWIGNFETEQNKNTIGVNQLDNRITIINWWRQLMLESYYYYKNKHATHNYKIDKAFVFLNNRITLYRSQLIDNMAKHKLLDHGYISWLKKFDEGFYDNEFKYFDNSVIKLTDYNSNIVLNEEIVEQSYFNGFVNIITEGDINFKDISEKTFYSILHKKPFLILGSTGIHQRLKDLGFKLYDNVFDYSFDSANDVNIRIEGIIRNLKSILDNDYDKLYKSCLDIVEFNYNRYVEILTESNSIDMKFLDYLKLENLSEHEYTNLKHYQKFLLV
jgi:hypothetical protein